jgi:hypothetical protein
MAGEGDAPELEIAGQRHFPRRVVPAAEQAGEGDRRVVTHQHRFERRGWRGGAAGPAVEEPPQRPQEQPAEAGACAQLKTTTPRAT